LNAAGKVIQIGIDINGKTLSIFENFLATGLPVLPLTLMIFRSEKTPPIKGRIPKGSGELRS